MIINKKVERKVTLLWIGSSFLAVHLLFLALPNLFESWNEQTTDKILSLKANSKFFRSRYDDTIVHVDLNNTSLHALNNYYLDRRHHGQVIRNLAAMNVAAQMYDFIFAGPTDNQKDLDLIRATQTAGNVYFGMAFRLHSPDNPPTVIGDKSRIDKRLQKSKWQLSDPHGYTDFYIGTNPLTTYPRLTSVSYGSGYLNLKPDRDGVFRRLPLLVRYENDFFPSFSLKVVCDFLGVQTSNIRIEPGFVNLKGVHYPGTKEKRDIAIPIDRYGNMRINFVGPWDRMKHYNFSDVYLATRDHDDFELWKEELSGRIILVSDVSSGSTDVGQVPTDTDFPLSGVHANSVHTILTETFLKELPMHIILLIEVILLISMAILSFQRSALLFTVGSLGIAGTYVFIVSLFIMLEHLLFPIIRPLLLIFFSMVSLHIGSAIENTRTHAEIEKAKQIAERDLEIGRNIQLGFFPKNLPSIPGWEIDAYFKPARQVAGDFYDAFKLQDDEHIGIVIADVCDKGVGAALFMALIRSLVRAFTVQGFHDRTGHRESSTDQPAENLLRTIQQTNNYIAKTHADDSMFATLFLGILNPKTGSLRYINCGHEPPVVMTKGEIKTRLDPTGPAIGLMPDLDFRVMETQFDSGDLLFAFTDGLTDAENKNKQLFTRDRLIKAVEGSDDGAAQLIEKVKSRMFDYIAGAGQFDDITMLAVKRH